MSAPSLASIAQDTATIAKSRAIDKLRDLAQTQLEICARAYFERDYELALQANTNARRFLQALAENAEVST